MLAGEAGTDTRPLGVPGAVESSTYVYGAEQADVFPAALVAVAANVVVVSSATTALKPDAKFAAVPDANGVPLQVAFV